MIGRWLDKLFQLFSGKTPAEYGQGLDSTTTAVWQPPVWTIVLVFLLAATLIAIVGLRDAASLRRKWALVSIRVALVGLVLLMMHGWVRYEYRTNLPDLLVLIDDSESMRAQDYYADRSLDRALQQLLDSSQLAGATRANLLKALLLSEQQNVVERLKEKYNLQIYFVGKTARRSSDEHLAAIRSFQPDEDGSHLGDGLRQVLELQRGRPTAAILFFTDGNTTEGTSISGIADYAKQRGVPLILFGVGSETVPTDLRVADVMTQPTSFVDDLIHFDAQIMAGGQLPANFRARVQLLVQGQSDALDEKTISLSSAGSSVNIRLSHRPNKAGKWRYSVRVHPLPNEANTSNNHLTRQVDVRDETIRVLMVQEYPSPEFRFLRSLLGRQTQRGSRNKSISLTTVLQEADPEHIEQDDAAIRAIPLDREKLYEFDVIIFGDVNRNTISTEQLAQLESFVSDRGGGLIVIAGPRHTPQAFRGTPLARILPIRFTNLQRPNPGQTLVNGFRVVPTNLGLATAPLQLGDSAEQTIRVWNSFPPIYWHLRAPDLSPAARVLVSHPTRRTSAGSSEPLVTMQVVGAGKVVFHAFDSSYRWSRSPEGSEYYQRYWFQMIRYLSRRQLLGRTRRVSLSSDQNRYRSSDVVRIQARFLDDGVTPENDDGVSVALQRPTGPVRNLQLTRHPLNRNVFTGQIANLSSGRYQTWVTAPTLKEEPASHSFEVLPKRGEDQKQHMAVRELRLAAEKSSGAFLTWNDRDKLVEAIPEGRQVRIESLPPSSVWNSQLFASLFVVLIVTEWVLRKQGGLS